MNLTGNMNTPYLYLYGTTLGDIDGATINGQQVTFNTTNGGPITVAEGDGSAASGYVVSANLLNRTSAPLVQLGTGGSAPINVQGDVNLSTGNIGQLFAYTAGSYNASGSTITLAPQKVLYANAGSINTGAVSGGSQAIFISSGAVNLTGNMNTPYLYLYGTRLGDNDGATISGQQITFNTTNGGPITVAEGDGSSATGYVVSANLLNRTSAPLVQLGTGGSGPINVQGNVNIEQAQIGKVFAYTSGQYSGTGSTTITGSNTGWHVNAGTIYTGGVNAGCSAFFQASGLLTVNGEVNAPEVIFDGNPVVYEPICFSEVVNGERELTISRASLPSCDLWSATASSHSIRKMGEKLTIREDGEFVLRAKNQCHLIVGRCDIVLKKGTVLHLKNRRDQFVARVIHDEALDSVAVTVNEASKKVLLTAGKQLRVVSRSNTRDTAVDETALRRTRSIDLAEHQLVTSEFSFLSLTKTSNLLSALLQCNSEFEKGMIKQVLKTSACLNIATGAHGPFQ